MAEALRTEAEVMQRWERRGEPLVSIVCTTYNHARYVEQAIVGFLMQVTNFPFEDVTLFKGLEGLGDLLTEPRALRDGYLQQLNDFTEQMKKMCRGMHVDFQRFNSGDSLDVALSGFLATRAASIK